MAKTLETLNFLELNIGEILEISGRGELVKDLVYKYAQGFSTHYKKDDKTIIESMYEIKNGEPVFIRSMSILSKHKSFPSYVQELERVGLW